MDMGNVTASIKLQYFVSLCFPNRHSFESCTVFVVEGIHGPARVHVEQSAVRVVPYYSSVRPDSS
jgi:hypothetical protein